MKNNFINEIYEFFNAKRRVILTLSIIVIVACPVLVWGIYLFGNLVWGLQTDLSADGMLGYWAAIISAISTVFLGFITLALSKKADKTNDDLLAVQKNQYLLEVRPFVMITDWKASGMNFKDIVLAPTKIYICIDKLAEKQSEVSCLSLFVTNTTKSFLLANYGKGSITNNVKEKTFAKSAANQFNTSLLLQPGETKELVLYGKVGFFRKLRGEKIIFTFYLDNRLGDRYQETFEVTILMYSDAFEEGIDDWYTTLDVQNYAITPVQASEKS